MKKSSRMLNILRSYRSVALLLIGSAIILALLKVIFWDYEFERYLPKTKYTVTYLYSFEGFNDPIFVSTFLPVSDQRQSITEEINKSPGMNFRIEPTMNGNVGRWETHAANGNISVSYSFDFIGSSREYVIDTAILVPALYPKLFSEHL